ncbi:MAG TPA: GNAT family N-acetyltransferase [Streptosporangiaceae bacterium]|nr:GNAT family N-acetyltransferase [Streptosporangiaceae bacterium]
MRPTRLISIDDAPAITRLLEENRDFLAPWEPVRDEDYFTLAGQRTVIEGALERYAQGAALPCVILAPGDNEGETQVVGRINLNTIVRGPFQSASVGYLVAEKFNGRGLATAAVADIKRRAFEDLGLHRLEAGTLMNNRGSQKVLERNGFERFGLAPKYLKIAGEWQDHILFQVLAAES